MVYFNCSKGSNALLGKATSNFHDLTSYQNITTNYKLERFHAKEKTALHI